MTLLSRLGFAIDRLLLGCMVERNIVVNGDVKEVRDAVADENVQDDDDDVDECYLDTIRFSGRMDIREDSEYRYLQHYTFEVVRENYDSSPRVDKVIGTAEVTVFRTAAAIKAREDAAIVFDHFQDNDTLFALLFNAEGRTMFHSRVPKSFDMGLKCINRPSRDVVYIDGIHVESEYRRQGIGSMLLTAIKEKFERYGLLCLFALGGKEILSGDLSDELLSFYCKNGFELRLISELIGGQSVMLFLHDKK